MAKHHITQVKCYSICFNPFHIYTFSDNSAADPFWKHYEKKSRNYSNQAISTFAKVFSIVITLCPSVGHQHQLPCEHSTDNIWHPIIMNVIRTFISIKSFPSLKLDHVRSKTKSQGEIEGKSCETLEAAFFIWAYILKLY